MSTYQIATFKGCSIRTITNRMKAYGIKGRPIKKPDIKKETLIRLYHDDRLSLKKIGDLYDMSPSGILKRMRKNQLDLRNSWDTNINNPKKPFTGSDEEKAYIIGFRIGDLGVRLSSKRTKNIRVNSNTTKNDQAELIMNMFNKYSDVWISKPNWRGVISTSTILHPSFSFLLTKEDMIEKWIRIDDRLMSAFVAGYIDAEGSFGIYNNRGRFRLGSYDKGILSEITSWLRKLGMTAILCLERKQNVHQRQDFWRITINERLSLSKLFSLILPYMKHQKRIRDFSNVNKNVISRLRNGKILV